MTDIAKFKISTAVLAAIEPFAYRSNGAEDRPWLAAIYVDKDVLVATNGHRIVVVPVETLIDRELGFGHERTRPARPVLIPRSLIRAHLAAVDIDGSRKPTKAWVPWETPEPPVVQDTEVRVAVDDKNRMTVHLSDVIETSARPFFGDVEYPDWKVPFETITTEGAPVLPVFDPKMFYGAAELLKALGDNGGLEAYGWDKYGKRVGGFEYRAQSGVRFMFMGMARETRKVLEYRAKQVKADAKANAKP